MDPQTHLKQRYWQTLSFLKPVLSFRREGRVLQVLSVLDGFSLWGPSTPTDNSTAEALKNPISPGQPG